MSKVPEANPSAYKCYSSSTTLNT